MLKKASQNLCNRLKFLDVLGNSTDHISPFFNTFNNNRTVQRVWQSGLPDEHGVFQAERGFGLRVHRSTQRVPGDIFGHKKYLWEIQSFCICKIGF